MPARGHLAPAALLNLGRLREGGPKPVPGRRRKEIENVFREVSSVLSPKQKAIFVMREMEDLQSSEIARILGCRESTVRNHLFNARKLMQEQLKKRFPEYSRLWRDEA